MSAPQSDRPQSFPLPRGLIIVLGIAAGVIALAGMRQVSGILGPIFLALVLTITLYPVRGWLIRRKLPSWLATLLTVLVIYAILIGLVVAAVFGVARLATLLPTYADELQQKLASLQSWAAGLGIGKDQVQAVLKHFNPQTLISWVGALLGATASVASAFLLLILVVLFMSVDDSFFQRKVSEVAPARLPVVKSLQSFAKGTRKYFVVATVFGAIVAVLDWVVLVILAVPGAGLWGLLAFVTNFIPNVGFIIGLIPPALLGLLSGGPGTMFAVIISYSVLNFVIQSVIQTKYVGDSVGLTTTSTFLSLIAWAYVLGPLGAILAVPMTLLVKAVLIDGDPDARWLQLFIGDEPDFTPRRSRPGATGGGGNRLRRRSFRRPAGHS